VTFHTRFASLLLALTLLANSAQAQHKHRFWSGPQDWYKDWLWWVGEATIAAIEATDAHSTILVRERCPGCVETNKFIGPHPRNRDVIILASVGFGIESLLHWGSWETCPDPNRKSRSWRIACDMLVPGIGAAVVGHGIVHNYHLASQSQSASPSTAIRRFQLDGMSSTRTELPNPILSRNELPPFVQKQFSGCGHSLTLCTPIPTATESKVDLRSVQFR
jgi:hypothetical protein